MSIKSKIETNTNGKYVSIFNIIQNIDSLNVLIITIQGV